MFIHSLVFGIEGGHMHNGDISIRIRCGRCTTWFRVNSENTIVCTYDEPQLMHLRIACSTPGCGAVLRVFLIHLVWSSYAELIGECVFNHTSPTPPLILENYRQLCGYLKFSTTLSFDDENLIRRWSMVLGYANTPAALEQFA